MSSYIHMMVELFKFILMMVVIFAAGKLCCSLTWHVLVWRYRKSHPLGRYKEKTIQESFYESVKHNNDLQVASVLIGVVLAAVIAIPPIVLYWPRYTENPETVKAQKASEDAAFAEGQLAAENGIPCEACPHGFNKQRYSVTATAEYSAWMRGWTAKTIELKKGRAQ